MFVSKENKQMMSLSNDSKAIHKKKNWPFTFNHILIFEELTQVCIYEPADRFMDFYIV